MMSKKTRKITTSGLMAAIAVVFLWISSVFPTGQLGFVAVSCVAGILAVIEAGLGGGIVVYVIASALGFLIVPNKTPVYLFMLFFGYYPILKSLAEKPKSRVLEWILKLVFFNGAMIVILKVLALITFGGVLSGLSLPVLLAAMNLVYVLFDIGLSRLIFYYINRISKNRKF